MFEPQAVVRILLGSISSAHSHAPAERLFAVHVTSTGSSHVCLLKPCSDATAEKLGRVATLLSSQASVVLNAPAELRLPHEFNAQFAITIEGDWTQHVCRFFFNLLKKFRQPHLEYAEAPPPGREDDGWEITPIEEIGAVRDIDGLMRIGCSRPINRKERAPTAEAA